MMVPSSNSLLRVNEITFLENTNYPNRADRKKEGSSKRLSDEISVFYQASA